MKYKEATKTYVALDKLMKDDVFKSEFDRIRFRHEQCYTHEVDEFFWKNLKVI